MKASKILIVCDKYNQFSWLIARDEIQEKAGPVKIVLDKDLTSRIISQHYASVLIEVSDLEALRPLVQRIHIQQPDTRIIVAHSSPTWKLTREVIRLGAASLVRKTAVLDEVIESLRIQPQSVST